MHSTLKMRDSDPHDIFAITPDVVPVAWADKVLADITRDAKNDVKTDVESDATGPASDQPPHLAPGAAAVAAAPTVDTTFRPTATATDDIPAAGRAAGERPVGQKRGHAGACAWAALPLPPPGKTTAMRRNR